MTATTTSKFAGGADAPSLTRSEKRPGFTWLWRSIIAVVLIGAVAVGSGIWWLAESEARFEARLAQFEAAGLPTEPSELEQEPVPDEENAALVWKDIAAGLAAHEKAGDPDTSALLDAIEAGEWSTAAQALDAHYQEELALAREAAKLGRTDWGVRFANPPTNTLPTHYGPQRDVARLLAATARRAAHEGRFEEALAWVELADRHGAQLSEAPGMVIGVLVVAAVHALQMDSLRVILRELNAQQWELRGDSSLRARLQEARAQVRRRDEAIRHKLQRGLHEETISIAHSIALVSELDAAFGTDFLMQLRDAARAESYPAALDGIPAYPSEAFSPLHSLLHHMSSYMLPSIDRGVFLVFRLRAEMRLVRAAIALTEYKLDHGEFPPTLDALVPAYLDAVPIDLMRADGGAIGYVPDPDGGWPRVYSVGEDGVDDGGEYVMEEDGTVDYRDSPDLILFLRGEPKTRVDGE